MKDKHNFKEIKLNGWWLIGFSNDSLQLLTYTSKLKEDASQSTGLIKYLLPNAINKIDWVEAKSFPNGTWFEYYKRDNVNFTQIVIEKVNNLDGQILIFNKEKHLTSFYSYKQGEDFGPFSTYYQDGNIYSLGFSNNGRYPEFISFYLNSHPKFQFSILNHYYKQWASNGHLIYYSEVDDSLQNNGLVKSWYSNGRIKFTGLYKQNKEVGRWVYYTDVGRVRKVRNYK